MVKKAKNTIRKRLDEEFLHTTETLWTNEIEANIFVAKALLVTAAALVISLILNEFRVFTVEKTVMRRTCGFAFLETIIPAIICYKLKGQKKWLKIIMLAEYTIVIARIQSVLNHNVVLAMVLPVVLSVRYYSKYVTLFVTLLSALLSGLSAWACVVLEMGILDLNFVPVNNGTTINIINGSLRESLLKAQPLDLNEAMNKYFVGAYLPRYLIFSLIAIICIEIAGKGRKAIFDQAGEAKKTERISTELNLASDIQSNMLPNIFPAFPERNDFDIYATMDPAKEVGGDFYDFFFVDDRHLALVIADVSGKGVPAAMFMVITKTLIKDHTQLGLSPSEVFTRVNNILCEGNDAGLFVTAWMGVLDLDTGILSYANAGHNHPVVMLNGETSFLKSKPGFVLAGMENIKYSQFELQLHRGDKIFLYTDGATEATNLDNELYGEERLITCLRKQLGKNVEDTLHGVRDDIDKFVGKAEQFDDLTLLAFDYYDKDVAMDIVEITVDAKVDNLHKVLEFLEAELEKRGASMKIINVISVAAEEMYANVCMYAYPNNKVPGECTIGIWFDGNDAYIMLIDNGIPFNPLEKADPNIHATAEERGIGGLGIYMVKQSMDDCTYERTSDGQNIFTMRKAIK